MFQQITALFAARGASPKAIKNDTVSTGVVTAATLRAFVNVKQARPQDWTCKDLTSNDLELLNCYASRGGQAWAKSSQTRGA